MPYIHPDLVSQVKQIDLLTYLQTYDPDELVHAGGGEYCTKTHVAASDKMKKNAN